LSAGLVLKDDHGVRGGYVVGLLASQAYPDSPS